MCAHRIKSKEVITLPIQPLPLALCVLAGLVPANVDEKRMAFVSKVFSQIGDTLAAVLAVRAFAERNEGKKRRGARESN